MAFEPPACRIPLLRKDRPATGLLNSSHQIVFNFVAFKRCRQKLIDLHCAVRGAMRDTNLDYDPVYCIQQCEQDKRRYYELAQSTLPVPHHEDSPSGLDCGLKKTEERGTRTIIRSG